MFHELLEWINQIWFKKDELIFLNIKAVVFRRKLVNNICPYISA